MSIRLESLRVISWDFSVDITSKELNSYNVTIVA